MKKFKKIKIHPNACPKCGQIFKKVSGIWRCIECGINKDYRFNDGRPREGGILNSTKIKALLSD